MKFFLTIGLCTVLSVAVFGCNRQSSNSASIPNKASDPAQVASSDKPASPQPSSESSIESSPEPSPESSPESSPEPEISPTVNQDQVEKPKAKVPAPELKLTATAFELSFYPSRELTNLAREKGNDPVMQREPRITQIRRHPCDIAVVAKVSQMPDPRGKDTLVPDKVVEVDAQNSTLKRWGKPLDSRLLAIAGDRILVEADQGQYYWIDTAGNITTAYTEGLKLSSPENIPYTKHPEFPPNGVFSQRFRDLDSGNDRRIIYDAPCT